MALLDPPDFFGSTIFCDDIRQEVDGKMTFVGSYGSAMVVHSAFPAVLSKFAFGITFVQRKEVFETNLGIRIFMPGDADDVPSLSADMTGMAQGVAAAQAALDALPIKPEEAPNIALIANLIFSPFTIAAPGAIKVRIERRGDLVRIGALSVISTPPMSS